MTLVLTEVGGAGRRFPVPEGRTWVVGRGPGASLTLDDPELAPRHLAVMFDGATVQVVDLGGPGGTFLDQRPLPVRVPTPARPGALLLLGSHALRVDLAVRERPAHPLPDDEFEVLRELGAGAFGRVYAARWRPHDRLVAVKVLLEPVPPGSPAHQRFLREAVAARIDSPHVVRVFELRAADQRPFVVSELVVGPCAQALVQRGPLPLAAALWIAEDVARALVAASAVGVVHRDVKPSNVLLTQDGVAKLCDFGIAKDLQSTLRTLTASGAGMGTLAYLAPEQATQAKHVDARADLYALGATLYHLLAGVPPFRPRGAEALLALVEQPPPPLREARPELPPPLCELVHACLAKRPEERPPLWSVPDALRGLRERLCPGAPRPRPGGP